MDNAAAKQQLAILFADIAGSTRLYQHVGDAKAHQMISHSLALAGDAIGANRGRLLRTVGDATLSCFKNCDDALAAAIMIQKLHAEEPVSVRTGFHYGEVIEDQGDIYGNATNIAARIVSLANPGEITTTRTCIELLSKEVQEHTHSFTPIKVKGIDNPLEVHAVSWTEQSGNSTIIERAPDLEQLQKTMASYCIRHLDKAVVLNSNKTTATLGREKNNDLVVESKLASRHHASIEWENGKIVLTDRSSNGTYFQKSGESPIYLLRESVRIESSGTISAGAAPTGDNTSDGGILSVERLEPV